MNIAFFCRCLLLTCLFMPFTNVAQRLPWNSFRQQVLERHPLSVQADLFIDQANAALLRAQGGFDPKAYADVYSKTFKEKTYFQYTETGIKWPSWGGLEWKAAYNLASGNYLNPENTLPSGGQATFGFNWSLGQGLLTDDRRTTLRQARISLQTADAERTLARSDLMLEAAKTYWTWAAADQQLRIYQAALEQSQIRHQGIRESFFQGDKPAVDTIESFMQVQNRQLDLNFAATDLQNARLALAMFLWPQENDESRLAEISAYAPDSMAFIPIENREEWLNRAISIHPQARWYQAKLQNLDLEYRLKREKLKPVLDLNYNLLGAGWSFFPSAADGLSMLTNDIKWGVQFSYPIPNRKGRGDVQFTRFKIQQTEQERTQKLRTIETKVRQYANELDNLRSQIVLFRDFTDNYQRLLEAENEKFRQGESSVFLINTREQRWLEAQIKYLKLLSEYMKAEAGLRWAAGEF